MDFTDLSDLYRDLHAHPELAFQEERTAGIAAERLRGLGYETTTGVGRTGVVGVLRNGAGPVALLRADMDALPVQERTGLPYASTARGTDEDGRDVPLMHACGHDMHVTCLLGAAADLAADRSSWQGTLLLVFQPAEEAGGGAQAMMDDGLYERFGTPAVVLGQHVAPMPAGLLGLRPGRRSPPRTRCGSCCTAGARTARAPRRRSTRSSWPRRPCCGSRASCPGRSPPPRPPS